MTLCLYIRQMNAPMPLHHDHSRSHGNITHHTLSPSPSQQHHSHPGHHRRQPCGDTPPAPPGAGVQRPGPSGGAAGTGDRTER